MSGASETSSPRPSENASDADGAGAVRACAGVALTGRFADRFATLTASPLGALRVVEDPHVTEGRDPRLLWSVPTDGGRRWRLSDDEGRLILAIDGTPVVALDPATGDATMLPLDAPVAMQLIAAFLAPAVAVARGAIALHGSSAARAGHGVAVIGPSGAGKSTLLRALTDAGWQALAEDVTVLSTAPGDGSAPDTSTGGEIVLGWPGPPWVRLLHGVAGPAGAAQLDDPVDKVAWSLEGRLPTTPVPIRRVVLLETPGGTEPEFERVPGAQAVARIPPHVTWLSAGNRASDAFGAAVRLVRRAEVWRLRLPRSESWTDLAVAALSGPRAGTDPA